MLMSLNLSSGNAKMSLRAFHPIDAGEVRVSLRIFRCACGFYGKMLSVEPHERMRHDDLYEVSPCLHACAYDVHTLEIGISVFSKLFFP